MRNAAVRYRGRFHQESGMTSGRTGDESAQADDSH